MADDWQVGDLAVCVNGASWYDEHTWERIYGPDNGWVGKVAALRVDEVHDLMLVFPELADPRGWIASSFRKIRPDAHEACEGEFVALLKRSRVSA